MSVSDPVADMLTKIRNANRAKLQTVSIKPVSKMKKRIVEILVEEGYVERFEVQKSGNFDEILLFLKYDKGEQAVLHDLQSISTPGRRFYTGCAEMPRILNGLGTLIVSTSQGVMTGRKAKGLSVGGELICKIW